MALLAGCSEESGPKLVPVSGVVTYHGKPLEGAVVTFCPMSLTDETPRPGESLTSASGRYDLLCMDRPGLPSGKYRVVITKTHRDVSNYPEAFKDDPSMAEFVLSESGTPKGGKSKANTTVKIDSRFDRDVPSEGAKLDFEVGSALPKAIK